MPDTAGFSKTRLSGQSQGPAFLGYRRQGQNLTTGTGENPNEKKMKAYQTDWTLQSIKHEIRGYEENAEEAKSLYPDTFNKDWTIKDQMASCTEQDPFVVIVNEFEEGTFDYYPTDQGLHYTQNLTRKESTREEVAEYVINEIRNWFDLSDNFQIQVEFATEESED